MKILFIYPQLKKYAQPVQPPLGLLSMAAVLEKKGHQVSILDLSATHGGLGKALAGKPDLVGITATTPLIKEAWKLSKICQRKKIPVIFGGHHVSALPDETLKNGMAQVVVRFEGEETMAELCQKWPKYQKVRGISYLNKGRVVHNPARPLIKNLDTLPFPAYHLLPDLSYYTPSQPVLSARKKIITIMTSRGCPYHCHYCYKGVFGERWRAHSAGYVLKLWEYLVSKYHIDEIGVEDDAFNLDPKRVEEICTGLIKKKIKVPWTTVQGLRADKTTFRLLQKMKKTGFYRTGFGIEAGSQVMIDRLGKNLKLSKVFDAIAACRKLGIESIGYFIIGNVGESETTMKQTIDLAKKIDPNLAYFTTAVPLPGSPLFEDVKARGKFLITDWALYGNTLGKGYFEIGEVKKELVERMWLKAYRDFYLRPKIIKRLMFRKNTWLNFYNLVRAALSYIGLKKTVYN